jgi:hypothetical protein
MAAVGNLTVLENMALGATRTYACRRLRDRLGAARADLNGSLARLGVTIPSADRPIGTLWR